MIAVLLRERSPQLLEGILGYCSSKAPRLSVAGTMTKLMSLQSTASSWSVVARTLVTMGRDHLLQAGLLTGAALIDRTNHLP